MAQNAPQPPADRIKTGPTAGQGEGQDAPYVRANTSRIRRAQDRTSSALLTMHEAASYLAVSYWTVRSWVENGRLASLRLPGDGRLVRVERSELDRLIAASRMSA